MTHPSPKRGFEAFTVGETGSFGPVVMERDAVVTFASAWDPQPFHLDEEAGKASPLGGHAASGWHTASLYMRLLADNLLSTAKSMGAGSVRDLKWRKPVLVGDVLTGHYAVTGVRPSSRGDRGYIEMDMWMTNQRGETVFSMVCPAIIGK